MRTFERKLARYIDWPETMIDVEKLVDEDIEFHKEFLCHMLKETMVGLIDGDPEVVGPKQFGVGNFQSVYYEDKKLPCLKNTIKLADKLGLKVVLRIQPYAPADWVAMCDFVFGVEYDHGEFIAFLEELATLRAQDGYYKAMNREREKILKKLSNPAFPIYWTTVIRYFVLCGYQFNCFLKRKQKTDGCLTPSQ